MTKQPPLPQGSATRIVPKIILYKLGRDSDYFKFTHDLTQPIPGGASTNDTQAYTAVGPDPADLDLQSSKVYAALEGKLLARLPFDCWLPRGLGESFSPITGQPDKLITLPAKQKDFYALEDLDATHIRLNWKNLHNPHYKTDFKDYVTKRKEWLLTALQTTPLASVVEAYDLSDYLQSYTHSTQLQDFNNSVSVKLSADPRSMYSSGNVIGPISSANFSESFLTNGAVGNLTRGSVVTVADQLSTVPLIEENDAIEIRVKYITPEQQDMLGGTGSYSSPAKESGFEDADGFQRVFIGFVSAVSRDFSYGSQETITLKCDGLSKMFYIYTHTFKAALGSSAGTTMDEGMESSDLTFSIFQNNFNAMNAADIFRYFMRHGLLSQSGGDSDALIDKLDEELNGVYAKLDALDGNPEVGPQKDHDAATQAKIDALRKREDEIITQADQVAAMYIGAAPSNIIADLISKATKNLGTESGGYIAPPSADKIDYNVYLTNTKLFTSADFKASFQTIHFIPMVLAAAKQAAIYAKYRDTKLATGYSEPLSASQDVFYVDELDRLSDLVATVEQGYNPAYRTLVASAFNMYMPELKTPAQIFTDVRDTTYLEIFEDRPGIIRMRPPKYNILNLNTTIGDFPDTLGAQHTFEIPNLKNTDDPWAYPIVLNGAFVISPYDIESVTVNRDDASIQTRADFSSMIPFTNNEVAGGYPGWYEDAAYLIKYGFRCTGMMQNPMSISPMMASYMSALELARKNKGARTIELTVMNNREYQVGRLYYIPVADGDTGVDAHVVSRGLVGYVTSLGTSFSYNSKPSHTLTLEHVRQAEILEVPLSTTEPGAMQTPNFIDAAPELAGSIMPPEVMSSASYSTDPAAVAPKPGLRPYYFANFKRLPDISTFMRKLATDKQMHADMTKGASPKGTPAAGPPSVEAAGSCFGRMVVGNGTKVTDLSESVVTQPYARTLHGLGVDLTDLLTDSQALETLDVERDIFCTPFITEALADSTTGTANLRNNFLGKLVLCDLDPLHKFYPYMRVYPPAAGFFAGQVEPPVTDGMSIRETKDLLYFIAHTVDKFVDISLGLTTDPIREVMRSPADYVYSTNGGAANTLTISRKGEKSNRKIVVSHRPLGYSISGTHSTLVEQVVTCFVEASSLQKGQTQVTLRKVIVFFVPGGKSARLANLVNTGVLEGGGFKSIATSKKDSAATVSPADAYANGSAVVFTDLEASLWSVADIVGSCAEFDVRSHVRPGEQVMPDFVAANWSIFLDHAYNTLYEPRKLDPVYGFPAGVDNGPIYSGVIKSRINYSDFGKDAFSRLATVNSDVLDAAKIKPAEYTESHILYSAAPSYRAFLTNLKSSTYVVVPIKTSFFHRPPSEGFGYFDKITAYSQLVSWLRPSETTISEKSAGNYHQPVPLFLLASFDKLVSNGTVFTLPKWETRNDFQSGWMTHNLESFREQLAPVVPGGDLNAIMNAVIDLTVSGAGLDKISVYQFMDGFNIQFLSNFLKGDIRGGTIRCHTTILIDSMYFKVPAKPDMYSAYNEARAMFSVHPLALHWHTGYAINTEDPFEAQPGDFTGASARGKLNLLAIPR